MDMETAGFNVYVAHTWAGFHCMCLPIKWPTMCMLSDDTTVFMHEKLGKEEAFL